MCKKIMSVDRVKWNVAMFCWVEEACTDYISNNSNAESVIVVQKGSLVCYWEEMLHTVYIVNLLMLSLYLMYYQD